MRTLGRLRVSQLTALAGTGFGGPAWARVTGIRMGMVGNMALAQRTVLILVVDGNLISARTPADLGPWMKALLKAIELKARAVG